MFDPKKRKELLQQPWFALTFAVCSGVVLFLILSNIAEIFEFIHYIFSVVSSIIIGVVLAYVINPLVVFFEDKVFASIKKKEVRHNLSVWLAFLILIFLIVLLVMTLIPSLTASFANLFGNMNTYIDNLTKFALWIEGKSAEHGIDLSEVIDNAYEMITNVLRSVPSYATTVISKSAAVGSSVMNYVIGIIFALYFLLGKEFIVSNIRRLRQTLYPDQTYKVWTQFWNRCNKILSQYIGMSVLEAIVVGAANAIFMLIFKLPYVSLISVIVGVTNLLPNIGPVIGCVLGMFILVLNEPYYALLFFIFTMILQTIDGYVIKPKLFGGSLGVPSSGILITIVVGGKLFGIMGILLAIPIAAILTFVYKEYFFPWLQKRKKAMTSV